MFLLPSRISIASLVRISCLVLTSIFAPVSAIRIVLSSVSNTSAATNLVAASCIAEGTLLDPLTYVTLSEWFW